MGDLSEQTTQLMRRMPTDRIAVLVVGDQGVGKTSLVRCMCNEVDGKADGVGLVPTGPTTGASVNVKLVGTSGGSQQFVELWEIGGSPTYAGERAIFYEEVSFAGVIVVHDLTNKRSFENMKDIWIPEVVQGYLDSAGGGGMVASPDGGRAAGGSDRGGADLQRRLKGGGANSDEEGGGWGAALGDAAGLSKGGAAPLEWHQAVSTCPGLPLLVIGTKSELAATTSNVSQDAKAMHPLQCVRASAATGQLEFGGLNEFFSRVIDRATVGSPVSRRWKAPGAGGGGGGMGDLNL